MSETPNCMSCGTPYAWDDTGIGLWVMKCPCVLRGWIGIDFDKTLAHYEKWTAPDELGQPIAKMINRVKRWLAEGRNVKIFTARVWTDGTPARDIDAIKARAAIQQWCKDHIGTWLEVTNIKDIHMMELWDDRCVQVMPNTGLMMGVSPCGLEKPGEEDDTADAVGFQ